MCDEVELLPDEVGLAAFGVEPIACEEGVVRLLVAPRMVSRDGKLDETCFPVDELAEKVDRISGLPKSCSVVRPALLTDREEELLARTRSLANPDKGQHAFGYVQAFCRSVRQIRHPEEGRVFKLVADPIELGETVDLAHAKIVRASDRFNKGFLRQYRDKLSEAFSQVVRYE
jgi:hypothetical protein